MPCLGLTAAVQIEKGWEDNTGHFEWIAEDGVNGWGEPAAYLKWTSTPEKLFNTFYAMSRGWCKGTSVHFLTSPILAHSPPVHMYSLHSPLYHFQGLYL
jgi:hypothetical protein